MQYFGIPAQPKLRNFNAWSPKNDRRPEWIDDYFFSNESNNYVVYTKDPMKKFLMTKDDVMVRCGLGSSVIFLVLSSEVWKDWWQIDQEEINDFMSRKIPNFDYQGEAEILTK